MRTYRWSDNDRYFGPFTYARERGSYKPITVALYSGDDESRADCRLRVSALGHTLICPMPPIVHPWRQKVYPHGAWDEATVQRLGRDWYWSCYPREYSFTIAEGALHLRFGRQTHDSGTDQSKCYFLPWSQWRHVRHSLYGLKGEHFADMPEHRQLMETWDWRKALEDACPKIVFRFNDFDGEEIKATTRIEEREWRAGAGWFKWLSWFRKPKVSRSLDIRFAKETGPRKGSWKGGTTGHSIDMLPGELHESAFRRYCAEHDMTFIGEAEGSHAHA